MRTINDRGLTVYHNSDWSGSVEIREFKDDRTITVSAAELLSGFYGPLVSSDDWRILCRASVVANRARIRGSLESAIEDFCDVSLGVSDFELPCSPPIRR